MSYDPYRACGPTLAEHRIKRRLKTRRERLSPSQKAAEDHWNSKWPGDEPITAADINGVVLRSEPKGEGE